MCSTRGNTAVLVLLVVHKYSRVLVRLYVLGTVQACGGYGLVAQVLYQYVVGSFLASVLTTSSTEVSTVGLAYLRVRILLLTSQLCTKY